MINLLPPDLKEQLAYSKHNAKLLGYFWLLILVVLLIGGLFGGAEYYLQQRQKTTAADLVGKQAKVDSYKSIEKQATNANTRISSIKTLLGSQAKYSALLDDLAAHTPKGVFVNSISLTGNDKQPVRLSVTANSYAQAVSFRDALVTSSRISGADIENVSNPSSGVYHTDITIGFKPGKAK